MRSLPRLTGLLLGLLMPCLPLAAAHAEPIRYELQPTSSILVDDALSPLTGSLALDGRLTLCSPGVSCSYRGYAVTELALSGGGLDISRGAIDGPNLLRAGGADIRDDEGAPIAGRILLGSALISEGTESPGVGFREWRQLALIAHPEGAFAYPFPDSAFPSSMTLVFDLEEQTLHYTFDSTPNDSFEYLGSYEVTSSNTRALATIQAESVPEPTQGVWVAVVAAVAFITARSRAHRERPRPEARRHAPACPAPCE